METKMEYLTVAVDGARPEPRNLNEKQVIRRVLNDHARLGWRFVQAVEYEGNLIHYFERPDQEL